MIGRYYMDAVKEYEGCALKVRTRLTVVLRTVL